uniref:Aromatic amino acid beta-eliminating lyase/threonine aldolase domain-containing protein n=1 Tax=Pyramimonas obovata TaxID=1411642 RepID=A0A7S0R8C3_9CHLO|mmetsp:Transcript_27791/g.60768  ORF Transcript_27791/g.60768 Transcript_27791/m.60768 type:complete len:367 (+) Transcript_27791:3-1103(+)
MKVLVESVLPSRQPNGGVDLRSDTVTTPTASMRVAMALATCGDDVFADDPTVNALEKECATMFEKEAALFVPTGTMGNLISVLVHCETRASEVILGDASHIHIYEQGGISQFGGVHPRPLPNLPDGTIDLELVKQTIRPDDVHFPTTRLLVLENTHNKKGGRVLKLEYLDAAGKLCREHGLKLHVDGARIFNASAAMGVPVARLLRDADSASICFSKALGAPAGSIIVGSHEFIAKSRRTRKALGGGLRQVGTLAAAALVGLRETPALLAHDHENAQLLAAGVNTIAPDLISVDMASVESNLVYINVSPPLTAAPIMDECNKRGVRILAIGPQTLRAVCHHQVSKEGALRAVEVLKEAVEAAIRSL